MKVRIFKPHTHAGTHHVPPPEGLVIEVPVDAGRWLIDNAGAQAEAVAPCAWPFAPAELELDDSTAPTPATPQLRGRTPRAPANPST